MKNTSAGIFFYSTITNRFLYLLRSDTNFSWGVPGGKIENDETLLEGLERECIEEIGYFPKDAKLIPLQKFVNNTFTYHTFFCAVENEFIPILNHEHIGYSWIGDNQHPKPLHPGLFSTVNIDIVKEKLLSLTENKNGTL
jgi:8-oxo-dGTP pyrophosphatase MutT (NUDIX family)